MSKPTPLASVTSLRSVRRHRPDYAQLACARFAGERQATGLTPDGFADALSEALGWPVEPESVKAWETMTPPPGDVHLAAEEVASASGDGRPLARRGVLETVPNLFVAADLQGLWVTGFQFRHGTETRCHVDIAQVVATSDRNVTVTNHLPTPRTEGRALPFRNEIEAQIANRHLVGHWKNTSDARYFGSLHLAILPGETVMEGHYTGFGSDIEVSLGRWRWVRLEVEDAPDLAGVVLREPAVLYTFVSSYSQYDVPLTLNDVREVA